MSFIRIGENVFFQGIDNVPSCITWFWLVKLEYSVLSSYDRIIPADFCKAVPSRGCRVPLFPAWPLIGTDSYTQYFWVVQNF